MQHLANKCDILCVQEHWLLAYEAKDLHMAFPEHNIIIRCRDDAEPMLPKLRTRGHSVTAILWKKEIDHIVNQLKSPGQHERLIAVELTGTKSLVLINTYMPTDGAKNSCYKDILDDVAILLAEYPSHSVIWTGDLNADIKRSKAQNDIQFKQFCSQHNLEVSPHTPDKATFHHFNGFSKSTIDLFVLYKADDMIEHIDVKTRDPLNMSPHDPVTAFTKLAPERKPEPTCNDDTKPPKTNWKKVDKEKYKEITEIKLEALKNNMDNLPAEILALRINSVLLDSANDATSGPKKKKSKRVKKNNKGWHVSLKPIAKTALQIHRQLAIQASHGTEAGKKITSQWATTSGGERETGQKYPPN